MAGPNARLKTRREAIPSTGAPGEPMSRSELAEAVNRYLWETTGTRYQLDAHTIARYERGAVRWPSAAYRSGLRAVLQAATDADLGFRPTRRGSTSAPQRASTTLNDSDYRGAIHLGASPADFLATTTVEPTAPARIGWTEVEHVRAATRAVAMSENLFGGALAWPAGAAQLRWAGQLLESRGKNDVLRAMAIAVGNLASVVAHSAFDITNYAAANRYFDFALWCADEGDSWSLRANTLAEMARKVAYLEDFDEALSMIEFAQVRSDRLTATAKAMLAAIRSRLLALTGRYADARAEIDHADASFADRDSTVDPPWLCYYDHAEHQGSVGRALIPITQASGTPELAIGRLEAAIQLQASEYPRSRTFSRIRLASLMMCTGYPREAVPIGRQAIVGTAALRSKRLTAELQGLAHSAMAHSHISDVADLHHDITSMHLQAI